MSLCLAKARQQPTCCLDNSAVDVVSDVQWSYVEVSLGTDLSCVWVYIQPLPRVSADLISTAEQRNSTNYWNTCTWTQRFLFLWLHPYLSSESSGSKAMLPFSEVPGSTDSGTTICMGSSRKCGASFSFTTVTVTVAVLTGRLGALLLRGLTFSTVRSSTCLSCASKSKGCRAEDRREIFQSHWDRMEMKCVQANSWKYKIFIHPRELQFRGKIMRATCNLASLPLEGSV